MSLGRPHKGRREVLGNSEDKVLFNLVGFALNDQVGSLLGAKTFKYKSCLVLKVSVVSDARIKAIDILGHFQGPVGREHLHT